MIASLSGVVASVQLDRAVLEVGGVGYLVHATPATLAGLRVGETARLATSLVVREDSFTLYGFADDDERAVFETVQTVSGVGPRLALAMLAVHTPDGLRRAVAGADIAALVRVPGIGNKGAQRIALELGDKLGPPTGADAPEAGSTASASAPRPEDRRDQVVEALVGLGWNLKAADDAVSTVLAEAGVDVVEAPDVAGALRAALRVLGGPRSLTMATFDQVGLDDLGGDGTFSSERIVAAGADDLERAAEAALRPRRLEEFVGQAVVRDQLSLVLQAALARGSAPDHVLLSGPPGLGKTTLAMIIAAELGTSLRVTSGPAIQHAGDLAAVLSSLEEGEVLFIDEIHRLARPAEELLYMAMEDFRVDVVVGKGAGASAIPLSLPPFTAVGATTRAGLLPAPLRDRFGFTGHLDFYSGDELERVLTRSAGLLGVALDPQAAREIAGRSRGTPRIANRLLRRVRDWAQVRGDGTMDLAAARAALEVYEVDPIGLDRLDRAVLTALCTRFNGGPVGLTTLAVTVGEEAETVETVAEPYLVREGLIGRTPRGRVATPAAWAHLGLTPPREGGTLFDT